MALDLNDKTSNGYTLTNNGATEYTADTPFVQSTIAAEVDSSGNQYLYTNNVVIDPRTDYTIELWIKQTSEITSGVKEFLHLENNTAKHVIYLQYEYNAGTPRLNFQQDRWLLAGANARHTVTLGTTWHHVVLQKSTTTIQIYLDGSAVGTTGTVDNSTGDTTTSNQVTIGAGRTVGSSTIVNPAASKIDDVRIWNDVRDATEIANNRSIELVGNETNLQAYWPFESVLGTTTSTTTTVSTSSSTTTTSTSITTSTSSSTTTTSTSTSSSTTATLTTTSSSTTTTSTSTSITTSSSTSSSTTTTSTSTSSTTSISTSTTTSDSLTFYVETIDTGFIVDHPGS